MAQTWRDVLFVHWPVEPAALDDLVPIELALETFGGHAWVGIAAYRVQGLRARLTLPVPRLSAFPEIDVRTYVSYGGMTGTYLLSVETGGGPAVPAAGRLYGVPHRAAEMAVAAGEDGWVSWRAERFEARYRPSGGVEVAEPGSLAHWLTERYCLYAVNGERVGRGELHHPPWPLRPAEAQVDARGLLGPLGLAVGEAPRVHYGARQDVLLWPLQRAD